MNHFSQDLKFAFRLLRRSPGFTAIVVLSLALGIGASTAMFTVVHAALLKPLPFKDSDRLVTAMNGPSAAEGTPLSYPQLLQWRDEFKVFDDIAAYFNWGATIRGAGEPEAVPAMRGTASLFSTLGVEPIVGRLFTKADEPREAEPVVLLSEPFWRRKYNADPNIGGRRLTINEQTYTVSGRRLSLNVVVAFALIGVLLAATEIYGVVSHAAQQRTREFGIRLALGAESTSVLGLVFRQGLLLAVIGASLGLAGALAMGGVLRAQLFGVEPSDPATLAAVCAGLIAVALVACYLPARRAVKISPASILREG